MSTLEPGYRYDLKIVDVSTSDSMSVEFNGEEHKLYLASVMTPACNTF